MRTLLTTSLLVSAAAVLLTGCAAGDVSVPSPSPTRAVAGTARTGCGSPVDMGPLPEWARAGFSGDSSMPHVLGDKGDIVAAMFGYPLAVSRPDGSANKILWVSKLGPYGELVIDAKLDGSSVTASRRVGLGPSIVDLPQPGCWHLTLTWSDHTDTMDLVYG
jgi:hypothetical protein